MTLSQELHESLASTDLLEASFARIWQHNRDRAFVIVSAWRQPGKGVDPEAARKDNLAATRALKAQIRNKNFGFIQLEGFGQEKDPDSGSMRSAPEVSLLVPALDPGPDVDGALLDLGLFWARAPGGDANRQQFGILYHNIEDGESAAYLVETSGLKSKLGKFSSSTLTPYFSRLRKTPRPGSKPESMAASFEYEWVGIKFADPPSGYLEGMARQAQGEICMDLCETMEIWRACVANPGPILVHAEMVELSKRLAETIAAEPRYHAKPHVHAGQYSVMVRYDRPEGGVWDLGRVAIARNGKPNISFLEAHQDKIAALLARTAANRTQVVKR